jgi:hypothetical protein
VNNCHSTWQSISDKILLPGWQNWQIFTFNFFHTQKRNHFFRNATGFFLSPLCPHEIMEFNPLKFGGNVLWRGPVTETFVCKLTNYARPLNFTFCTDIPSDPVLKRKVFPLFFCNLLLMVEKTLPVNNYTNFSDSCTKTVISINWME